MCAACFAEDPDGLQMVLGLATRAARECEARKRHSYSALLGRVELPPHVAAAATTATATPPPGSSAPAPIPSIGSLCAVYHTGDGGSSSVIVGLGPAGGGSGSGGGSCSGSGSGNVSGSASGSAGSSGTGSGNRTDSAVDADVWAAARERLLAACVSYVNDVKTQAVASTFIEPCALYGEVRAVAFLDCAYMMQARRGNMCGKKCGIGLHSRPPCPCPHLHLSPHRARFSSCLSAPLPLPPVAVGRQLGAGRQ
jgi:hypothetical protein